MLELRDVYFVVEIGEASVTLMISSPDLDAGRIFKGIVEKVSSAAQ